MFALLCATYFPNKFDSNVHYDFLEGKVIFIALFPKAHFIFYDAFGYNLSAMCLIYMTNNLLSRKQEKEKKKDVWYSSSLLPCQADVWICFVFNRNNMDGEKNGATVPTYGEQPHISLFYTDLGSVCIHHNLIAEKQYWS